MSPHRALLAIALGAALGFALALSGGVLADRGGAGAELPEQDARLLAEVLGRIREEYVERTDEHELMSHAIRGMVSGLDPHSSFMDHGEFADLRIATEGSYSGIGIEVALEDGAIVVIAPLDGSPAAQAGIEPGDRIVAIDGQAVGGTSLAGAIERMRGQPGTAVRVTLDRDTLVEPLELEIERALVSVQSVRHELLEPGYGYLRISQFSETTAGDAARAIRALERQAGGALRGLVLDLRNNPGGVLEAAVEVSDGFLDSGVIVTADGRSKDARFRMVAQPGDLARGAPMAVLVNGGSASASEIVAGALQDNGRATVLGRRTFGKGSVQTVLPLSDGQALKLTTSRYYTPSGRSIQARGLEPDIELPRSGNPPGPRDPRPLLERDGEVRAALDWLRSGHGPPRVAAEAAAVRR